jgi:dCMP deaminase
MKINFEEFKNTKERSSWELYAFNLAKTASSRSEDPFVKVGACALRFDKSIAALGYNGPPRGVNIDWSNRDERRKRIIHAEANCLSYCKPHEIELIAITMLPCSSCLNLIAAYGIKRIIYGEIYKRDELAFELAKEYNISLEKITNPALEG